MGNKGLNVIAVYNVLNESPIKSSHDSPDEMGPSLER